MNPLNQPLKYQEIEQQLDKTRELFENSCRSKQRRLLIDSYVFAAISVQTPVDIHEAAFKRYKNGESLEDALESVNYNKNKASYIKTTRARIAAIDQVINHLENNDINKAHRVIVNRFKGVGTVKAAFTLAMLGYKSRACIDTNVLNAAGIDRDHMYNGVVIEKYNAFCDSVFEQVLGDLYKGLSRFMAQWMVFDRVRGEVTTHKTFFEHLGTPIKE